MAIEITFFWKGFNLHFSSISFPQFAAGPKSSAFG